GQDQRIPRIHLVEDAGKLMHAPDKSHSLVNYNRAGVPLIEIVTEPDFDSAEAAKRFCQELQRILRSLEISSADMEKGLMRCEANISVSRQDPKSQDPNPKMGTKVEVKNINSFRSVEKAIQYEFDRQTKALEAGETLQQETRTWDENNSKTVVMRTKETSADYRYFPEPDLPFVKTELKEAGVHALPEEQRTRLADLGIPEDIASVIVDRGATQEIIDIGENGRELALEAAKLLLAVPEFAELSTGAKTLLVSAKKENGWGNVFVQQMIQNTERTDKDIEMEISLRRAPSHDLAAIAREVINENPKIVADIAKGNQNAINALVGQVMKKTKGAANVAQARSELEKQLKN
ncbi:MAG: Asp-tRNA(Asn)/Glu-tRNA(Gln) amidotransferase GatCAB subunit B, partial [Patescibacteria group bacterium]